jgi:hypothetical protein
MDELPRYKYDANAQPLHHASEWIELEAYHDFFNTAEASALNDIGRTLLRRPLSELEQPMVDFMDAQQNEEPTRVLNAACVHMKNDLDSVLKWMEQPNNPQQHSSFVFLNRAQKFITQTQAEFKRLRTT